MTDSLLVGHEYLVPSIQIKATHVAKGAYYPLRNMPWVPVWPQLHDDADIGFPQKHYHVDWRFVSDEDVIRVIRAAYTTLPPNVPVKIDEALAMCILYVILEESVGIGPCDMLCRCHRTDLRWPYHHRAPEKLEVQSRFKDAQLKCGRCPHWGFDLRTVKPDENGIIQCPGHGLCFHADTGKIAKRREVRYG